MKEYGAYNIHNIEQLTESEVKELAIESLEIKGHTVYLVDFGGYFGYSALVFSNGHHMTYANDYELHHKHMTRAELKSWYLDTLSHKLFTEAELDEPLRSYDEYTKKDYYLRNLYPQRYDHISMFYIVGSEEGERIKELAKTTYIYPCRAVFASFKERGISEHIIDLSIKLDARMKQTKSDYDYLKSAFVYEMYNHEYGINWQADYDVLSCFGNLNFTEEPDEMQQYFNQLGFNETQKKAYIDARNEYFANAEL